MSGEKHLSADHAEADIAFICVNLRHLRIESFFGISIKQSIGVFFQARPEITLKMHMLKQPDATSYRHSPHADGNDHHRQQIALQQSILIRIGEGWRWTSISCCGKSRVAPMEHCSILYDGRIINTMQNSTEALVWHFVHPFNNMPTL